MFVGMSLRTYLEAAFKDGKAPLDPSTLVCSNFIRPVKYSLCNYVYCYYDVMNDAIFLMDFFYFYDTCNCYASIDI